MRLDKFLKVSRIIKRRQVAKDLCDKGRVQINDKVAKSGTQVAVGDRLTVEFGRKVTTFEVLDLKESTKKQDAAEMFRVLDETFKNEHDEPEFYQ